MDVDESSDEENSPKRRLVLAIDYGATWTS